MRGVAPASPIAFPPSSPRREGNWSCVVESVLEIAASQFGLRELVVGSKLAPEKTKNAAFPLVFSACLTNQWLRDILLVSVLHRR